MSNENKEADACCYTHTEKKSFLFKWVIAQFSERLEEVGVGNWGESSKFKVDFEGKQEWYVVCYPNGESEDVTNYVSIFACKTKPMEDDAIVHIEVWFQDKEGNKTNYRRTKLPANHDITDGYGWPGFIKRSEIKGMLCNDELIIMCRLSFSKNAQYHVKFKTPGCRMSEEFGQLLSNEELSDVTLVVQGQKVKAHKAVLAARSAVFAAMFKHDMQETNTNSVQITDAEPTVIREMLEYIYTGKLLNIKSFPDKLLKVSDKYGLEGLKSMCEQALVRNLSVENAADTLTLSEMHCAEGLKNETTTYIITHYNEVKKTLGWKSMVNSSLLEMLLDKALPTAIEPTEKI